MYISNMIIQRDIYEQIKPVIPAPEAIIITGMRRVGKTTLLKYIMENLPSRNVLYLDLENPLNRKYFEEENFDKIMDSFRMLGLDTREQSYIFLDEIQFIRTIPSVVKYLIDNHGIKFFLSGSASFYLKNLFTESLSGRKYIFELYPFSFHEYMRVKDPKIRLPREGCKISSAVYGHLSRYYEEYLIYGGFPGIAMKDSAQEKTMALSDIFTSYFQLEVEQLSDFRKTNAVRDLILLLMERIGSKLDVQKLSKELGISRITLNEYLSFLEHTYFLHLIKPFSRKKDIEIRSAPKVYFCDTGLLNQMAGVNEGALLENAVFLALQRKGRVNYYQKKSGVEIDFILDSCRAFEVKSMPYQSDINKLAGLTRELRLETFRIVSKKYVSLPQTSYGFCL